MKTHFVEEVLRIAVGNLPGVRSATVRSNPRSCPWEDLPPYGYEVTADGGDDFEIARTIGTYLPAGCQTHGGVALEVATRFGQQVVQFSRPAIGMPNPPPTIEEQVQAAVAQLPGVVSVSVRTNRMMYEDRGMPPKSIELTVEGGDDQAIAMTILANIPVTYTTAGTTVHSWMDDCRYWSVRFNRPGLTPSHREATPEAVQSHQRIPLQHVDRRSTLYPPQHHSDQVAVLQAFADIEAELAGIARKEAEAQKYIETAKVRRAELLDAKRDYLAAILAKHSDVIQR